MGGFFCVRLAAYETEPHHPCSEAVSPICDVRHICSKSRTGRQISVGPAGVMGGSQVKSHGEICRLKPHKLVHLLQNAATILFVF